MMKIFLFEPSKKYDELHAFEMDLFTEKCITRKCLNSQALLLNALFLRDSHTKLSGFTELVIQLSWHDSGD